jgi:hypothetical protein
VSAPTPAWKQRRGLALKVREFTDDRPYVAVGAALLAGYALSGALFTRATLRLLGAGLRMAVLPLLQERLDASLSSAAAGPLHHTTKA